MTRKHFKAIAEVIAAIEDKETRRQVATALAVVYAETNPAFSRTRFVNTCEEDA